MSCDNMRIDHYQELMNRGWRRSGSLYYKPDLLRSCCPHYTIRYSKQMLNGDLFGSISDIGRLNAAEFKAKKDQRQSVNRWNDFIIGSEYKRKAAMLCPQTREHARLALV